MIWTDSEASARRDLGPKREKYREAGVAELLPELEIALAEVFVAG